MLCYPESVTVFRRNLSTLYYFWCFLFIWVFQNKPAFSINSINVHNAKIKKNINLLLSCFNNKISLFVFNTHVMTVPDKRHEFQNS